MKISMNAELKKNLQIINSHLDDLKKTYNVKKIGIFGSVAKNQHTKKSDIDILVEFSKTPGFFRFIELEDTLTKILKRKVDLVTKRALKPIIKKGVLETTFYA